MRYFDYEKVARDAKIPADKVGELRRIIREEFPRDEMMYEPHLLRACMAIKQGLVSIEDAIKSEQASKA